MQLNEFVNARVEIVQPGDTLQLAAEKMRELDVGSLPVCDGAHLLGMITDRDITIRAIADGRDPAQTPVRDAMTPTVEYVFEDDDVQRAAQIMQDKQIRRLPVVSRDKKLVGIVALGDIARTGDDRMSGNALQDISDPDRQPSEARDDRA